MAITVTELQDSRAYGGGRGTLKYIIQGTAEGSTAYDSLWSEAPSTYGILIKRSARVERAKINTNDEANSFWFGEVTYFLRDIPQTGDDSYQFETGGGTEHINVSKSTVKSYAPPAETADNHKQSIGVTEDRVEGTDIVVPRYDWSETKHWADSDVGTAFKLLLSSLTGTVNAAEFRGLPTGSVLFMGASGQYRGGAYDDWEITYRFSYSPTHSISRGNELTIGDIINIEKEGWDYLWVQFEDSKDAVTKGHVKIPKSVHVERVYERTDFGQIDTGESSSTPTPTLSST